MFDAVTMSFNLDFFSALESGLFIFILVLFVTAGIGMLIYNVWAQFRYKRHQQQLMKKLAER